ncbi:vancomycin resistance protein YoaR [Paenibacillus cellulosilyticus]|uniref:Vancomycin resistance protein YoaR n=1 Tax=Paenibacillus cellulosilyticus TaxID=375489 RepID=A0A2V2YZK2_9BACL|nr:VanW family protein [Paenibacillus cellulosilyticus]PWW08305.1 vancomycin resistance protein YoaR [Paenibacillus cellulosilyticus]QKS47905.1 VanW family protein [Paenibacillus cellulosilyticus]
MKRIHVLFIIVLGLLLVASTGWGAVWMYANNSKVPEGVTVDGIQLGGMEVGEAASLLTKYTDQWEQQQTVIQANDADVSSDSRAWTLKELGYDADASAAIAALKKLQEGDLIDRARYRHSFEQTLSIDYSFEPKAFDKAIRQQWGWIDSSATTNATRVITANDRVVYTPSHNAYRLDVDTLRNQVNQWVEDSQTTAATNAADLTALGTRKLELPLPIKTVEPEVTLEKLKAEGIDRMIMSFTTDFASSAEGRAYNVTSTAKVLNDVELAPDEVFSYGKIVAATEKKYGYREAPVIQNGKLVPGIGGGICQVSSTLYNAIIRAGLDIVERRNHSLPVSYLPIGQDATFASGAIDFRFKNTTGKHLIIRTVVEDRKLTVKLFGTLPDNVRYDIESITTSTIEPTIRETVSDTLPPGGRLITQQGKQGYVVETYRTLVRDGKVVSRERLSKDKYNAQPTLVSIGKGTEPSSKLGPGAPNDAEQAPIIEDGVGTQAPSA